MALQVLVGSQQFDAAAYARDQLDDTDPTNYLITDAELQRYARLVADDISRYVPMYAMVGNLYANTSPLVTVLGQQRYLCNAANGFTSPVEEITDVLYRASTGYSAASEIGYMALLPFSPVNSFLFSPNLLDNPSQRVVREGYMDELERYGKGQAGILLDSSGSWAIDLFPIPMISGLPVYVRYATSHQDSTATSTLSTYATIPNKNARHFADLLLCRALQRKARMAMESEDAKAGLIEVRQNALAMRLWADEIRDRAYLELGASASVGLRGEF